MLDVFLVVAVVVMFCMYVESHMSLRRRVKQLEERLELDIPDSTGMTKRERMSALALLEPGRMESLAQQIDAKKQSVRTAGVSS